MSDRTGRPKNKIELESQVLCAALRQSLVMHDTDGAITSARELYQLFPDLLPPPKLRRDTHPLNYYEVLKLKPQAGPAQVLAKFLAGCRKMLATGKLAECKEKYNKILDAGFVLRKPRLRLSHDLVVARRWLVQDKAIPEDGSFEVTEPKGEMSREQLMQTQPLIVELPRLLQLLKEAQLIGPAEVQALVAQTALDTDLPLEKLVLDSGYVTQQEMNSLKLAEVLLGQGKITMAQFQVAIYDERTSGIRMAESLQLRGWLPTDAGPPD